VPHSVPRFGYGVEGQGFGDRLSASEDLFLYSKSFKWLWESSGILATVFSGTVWDQRGQSIKLNMLAFKIQVHGEIPPLPSII
jgi:hypothetical protein